MPRPQVRGACQPIDEPLDGLGPRDDSCHCSEQSADGRKEQEGGDADSFAPKATLNAVAILNLLAATEPK